PESLIASLSRPSKNSEARLALAKTSTITAPVVCHHCEEAPCLQVCPVNAISQRDDAIQLNESLCIGCKLCAVVCPFGAISAS
ncbi:4Fe-4S binding protein, partial [Escherichia sp. TWPC-MK]